MFDGPNITEIRDLREQLTAVARGIDPTALSAPEVVALLGEAERIERIGRSLKVLAAPVAAASENWRQAGYRSEADWLAAQTGSSKADAAKTLATGNQAQKLPSLADAMKNGELSPDAAAAVADAASAAPDKERDLVELARNGSLNELRNECRRAKAAADPDPEATRRKIHVGRSHKTWTDADGVGHIHLAGPSDEIARINNAVQARADRIFTTARREGRCEPLEAYRFDAHRDAVLREGDDSVVPKKGADAKIIVRIDHAALMRGHTLDGEVCEIAGVGPVPVSVVREWMDDAFIGAIYTKGTDICSVVHLGRRFTALQRTALQWRDGEECVRKGCTNTVRLQYDHDQGVEWANTHTTTVNGGDLLCPGDHRLKTIGHHLLPPDRPGGKRELIGPNDSRHPLHERLRAAVDAAKATRRNRKPGLDPPEQLAS